MRYIPGWVPGPSSLAIAVPSIPKKPPKSNGKKAKLTAPERTNPPPASIGHEVAEEQRRTQMKPSGSGSGKAAKDATEAALKPDGPKRTLDDEKIQASEEDRAKFAARVRYAMFSAPFSQSCGPEIIEMGQAGKL
ncbi:unnamed protein product [Ostreobium quekettii]|uniref:Uncharacterized protein n=1 Tax=Ostreobium quekettii TaxID=121088 RepID=A0A8S1IMP4_9CHLO|nr:unnamed protein product [Ostreobium quekettii]